MVGQVNEPGGLKTMEYCLRTCLTVFRSALEEQREIDKLGILAIDLFGRVIQFELTGIVRQSLSTALLATTIVCNNNNSSGHPIN